MISGRCPSLVGGKRLSHTQHSHRTCYSGLKVNKYDDSIKHQKTLSVSHLTTVWHLVEPSARSKYLNTLISSRLNARASGKVNSLLLKGVTYKLAQLESSSQHS